MLKKSLKSHYLSRANLQRGLILLGVVALTGCGGGGKREAYHPTHIYVFGDEFSSIDNSHSNSADNSYVRYTVNEEVSTTPNPIFNPLQSPLWIQYLASHYSKGVAACGNTDIQQMSVCAVPGDTVDKVISKINSTNIKRDDLLVVLVGAHDIIAQFQTYKNEPTTSIDSLSQTIYNLGASLGQKINQVIRVDARVAISTVPDLGLSPYATAQGGALRNGNDGVECDVKSQNSSGKPHRGEPQEYSKALSYLTACFNQGLRGLNGFINDGTRISLIDSFSWTIQAARDPVGHNMQNVTDAACEGTNNTPISQAPLAYNPATCTTATAKSNYGTYLWSFGPWLGPGGHAYIGGTAITRVNSTWGN